MRTQTSRRRIQRSTAIPLAVRWRHHVSRRLRTVGLLLIIGASLSNMLWSDSGTAGSAHVVLAARDLPLGHRLAASDLRVVEATGPVAEYLPRDPPGPDDLDGETLAVPVNRDQPIFRSLLVSPALTEHLPDGLVAVAVRIHDLDSLVLLGPGAPVRLVTHDGQGNARSMDAVLLWAPRFSDTGASRSPTESGKNVIFVGTDTETAAALGSVAEEAIVLARSAAPR